MRTLVAVGFGLLAVTLVALAPGAFAAPGVACTSATQEHCEAFVCVDSNLNGRYDWSECEPRYCTCDPQPQPW